MREILVLLYPGRGVEAAGFRAACKHGGAPEAHRGTIKDLDATVNAADGEGVAAMIESRHVNAAIVLPSGHDLRNTPRCRVCDPAWCTTAWHRHDEIPVLRLRKQPLR